MERTGNIASGGNADKGGAAAKMRPLVLLLLRFLIYAALGWVQMAIIRRAALVYGAGGFKDDSIVENLEVSTLGAAGITLLIGAFCFPAFRGLGFLLATLAAVGCTRELDDALDELIPITGWQGPALAVLIVGGILVWRYRRGLASQLRAFALHRSFALMWAGALVAVCFAQMMGQATFLKRVLGDDYTRGGKNFIEESAERV